MLSCGKRIWWTRTTLPAILREISNEPASQAVAKSEKLQEDHVEVVEASSIIPTETGLVERREYTDAMVNVDPFDEVPGPVILRKVSAIWKYLPVIGCQATVSALLSIFKLSKISDSFVGMRSQDRPFSRLFRKYGPIVKLHGPLGAEVVLIWRPEHIARVYEQEGKYPIRSTLDSVDKCRSQTRKTSGGTFNLNGIEWEEMRKAIEEPLMKGGERYFKPIQDAGNMLVKRIHTVMNRQNEVRDTLMLEISKWSLECICLITLNKSLGFLNSDNTSETSRLLKAVIEATDSICKCESGFQLWRFVNTPALATLSQACETIDGILSKHIRQAQVNLSRKKEDSAAGPQLPFIEALLVNECMTPEEVLTCVLDILLIGVNTSSSALGFLLYHLAQNQRAQRTLYKEVRDSLPEKGSNLELTQLGSMPYLQACLKESLRLKMPMPILTRVLAADTILSNFRIPKGTYMVMDAQAACLKETDFEKPEKFLPERWLEPFNVHPFSFIPFGHGLRSCVGRYLAETQLKSCVAKIIRNYQIEYNYGDVQAVDSVISFPNKPLKLSFIEREE